jgi:hypothetical protein
MATGIFDMALRKQKRAANGCALWWNEQAGVSAR